MASLKEMVQDALKNGISTRAKVLIAVIVLVGIAVGGLAGYQFYDFTQHNPNFCVSCHIMEDAFDAWKHSAHGEINCHECHHLTIPEMNNLMYSFIFERPEELSDRHGKVIVPWKYCVKCHWQEDEKYPDAPKINESKIHAKHYFTEQIECTKCHGYKPHMFVPEERFCVQCHSDKTVHGKGMGELACLNCHTDAKADLLPDRAKCLFCHGTDADRTSYNENYGEQRFAPAPEVIESAIKVNLSADSPMKFECYTCHTPHEAERPDWSNCIECHKNIANVGKHSIHLGMGLECSSCHKPHQWTVTKEQAKKECTMCHGYKSPESFLK